MQQFCYDDKVMEDTGGYVNQFQWDHTVPKECLIEKTEDAAMNN